VEISRIRRQGGAEVEPAEAAGLGAEHDVLQHGEVVGEHEVLVHHADAGGDRVRRRAEGGRPAVDLDGALVRLLHAVEDLHQGGLAGAVLTDDRVHGAGLDGDVDVPVGHHAGNRLVMPRNWTAISPAGAGADVTPLPPRTSKRPGATPSRRPRTGLERGRQETVVGTLIVPSMICFL